MADDSERERHVERLTFPAPAKLLSSNDRGHWRVRQRLTRTWRDAVMLHAANANLTRLDRAHITIEIAWPDKRSRDVNNWQPTAKMIVDGLVGSLRWPGYGLLPDDDDTHLIGPDLRRGEPIKGSVPQVTVTIDGGAS